MHRSLFDPPSTEGTAPAEGPAIPPAPTRKPPPVISVSLLVSSARSLLERELGLAWVSGEVSGFNRAASGHCYFNLKDASAQVRCVMFRSRAQFLDFPLRDGVQVEVRATPTIYDQRGEFQLTVDNVRLAGVGRLYERFAQLKSRLGAQGWFDASRKRALPPHPRCVGIVTSPRAAALSDVITTLRRRWPALRLVIYPCSVQGASAAPEIATALRVANARSEADVLIVCRGGGSIEDLWPFNEENVARAIFESRLPVISGVGHETDFTIADFVADVRAPTPTAAAMLVSPDGAALSRALRVQSTRWHRAMLRALEMRMQRLDHAAQRLTHPAAKLRVQEHELARSAARLRRCHGHHLDVLGRRVAHVQQAFAWQLRRPLPQAAPLASAREAFVRAGRGEATTRAQRLWTLAQNLAHLDPGAVLERGYAIVSTPEGDIVTDAARLTKDDRVSLALARGRADARIESVQALSGKPTDD